MQSSNPVLTRLERAARDLDLSARPMTIGGTAAKTLLLLAVTIFSAGLVWARIAAGQTALIGPAVLLGGLGGLVLGLVTVFRPLWARVTAPLYAAVEGLFLGAFAALLNSKYPGVPLQALALTFGIAGIMLGGYRLGLWRATPVFQRVMIGSGLALSAFYGVSLLLSLFGVSVGYFTSTSPWAIGLNVLIVAWAAFSLILDVALVEEGVARRAPHTLEWYAAFGILTTLVMLFVELARLLGRRR